MSKEAMKLEPCGGCYGSGWITRDPDIGTDQECFVCGGSGACPKEPEQEPCKHERINDDGFGGVWSFCTHCHKEWTNVMEAQHEPVAHSVIAGALFDFMGWLTSRKERLVLSSADEASPAVDAIRDFAKMRGFSLDDAKVQDWHTSPPAQRKPLTDEQMRKVLRTCQSDAVELLRNRWLYVKEFGRALEAAHGIKE